jgi:serine/threonine protein phosphatase PrpC
VWSSSYSRHKPHIYAFFFNIPFGDGRQAFYGVYDGHGGRGAVDFVADQLGKNVAAAAASRQEEEDEVIAAIRSAYLTTDSDFLSQVRHTHLIVICRS